MIYFCVKYIKLRMDFSEYSEFLGPLIFGLIAWLSSYFQKKKKKDLDKELSPDINDKSSSTKTNDKLFNKVKDSFFEGFNEQIFPSEDDDPSTKKKDLIPNPIEKEIKDPIKEETLEDDKLKPQIDKKNELLDNSQKDNDKFQVNVKSLRNKLKNKNSLKEAFVLKEILDKKY